MTEDERQQAAAAAAAEVPAGSAEPEVADPALDDEAPPDIPDLSELAPRLSSKPPPKPHRQSSGSMPATRPGSIPPPPPSARRIAVAEYSLTSPRVPNVDVIPASAGPGSSRDAAPSGSPASTPPGARLPSQPPSAPTSPSRPPPSQPVAEPSSNPSGNTTAPRSPLGSVPDAQIEPPRPLSQPPRPLSQPPRPLSQPPPAKLEPDIADVSIEYAETDEEEEELPTMVESERPIPDDAALDPSGDSVEASSDAAPQSEETVQASGDTPPDSSDDAEAGGEEAESPEAPATISRRESGPPADPQGSSAGLASRGVTIPDDSVPDSQAPMEVAPSPPSALMAMRIISIGAPEAPPSDDLEDVDAEELEDDDIAPSSGPISDDADAADGRPKPPPPPLRRPKKPPPPRTSADKERAVKEAQQKRKVRPWWEELFGDDFSRAIFPPTREQISAEVDFIERSLGVAKGGVILDLACGSGDHAIELASRGYAVVGYDLSITMLAQAQEIAQERDQKLNFLQGDMREMAFEETFDGIYCWSSSFGYFEEEKNINVAQRMFKALRPGGTLVLDIANRDYVAAQTPSSVWFEGDSCVCMDDAQIDWITSRLKVKRTVMLDDGRSKECNYSVRLYGLHELGKLLHDVGFAIRNASGQIATPGVFFGPASPNIIVLAQRPKE